MSNVRSVLSIVMLCSIASGSVFLEGMEKEVKKVDLTLRLSNGHGLMYMDIKEKPDWLSFFQSKYALQRIYNFPMKDNEPILTFDMSSKSKIYCYGETMMTNVRKHSLENKCVEIHTLCLPVGQLLNKNGTFKKDGDRIKIEMTEEKFDIHATLKDNKWNNKIIKEELYKRMKMYEKKQDYSCS